MDKGWSEKNKQMQSLLNKKDTFKEAIDVLLSLEYKDLKRKFDGSFSEKLKSSYYACGGYAPGNDDANAAKAQALYIRKYGKKEFLKVHDRKKVNLKKVILF